MTRERLEGMPPRVPPRPCAGAPEVVFEVRPARLRAASALATFAFAMTALPAVAAGREEAPKPSSPSAQRQEALRGTRLAELWGDLAVRDLDGRAWTAADLENRVVLLEFWATWCAPCLADFPHLRRAREAHGEQDLVILAVSLDRMSRRDLQSFVRRQRLVWQVVHDGLGASGTVARRFQVDYPPRSMLFDRQGRLVALDARGETLEAALRALFATERP